MKIAMLVSGGVDSSVSLKLLKDQGHDVHAFYIKIWLEDKFAELGACPWEEDLQYVRATCKQLDVPLQVISLQKEYWDEVIAYTIKEVKAGRTPNPDVLCNQRIKFGRFYEAIKGYDKVASGHYAQTRVADGKTQLICAPDPVKDQTYFLAMLSQDQLHRALFPIGHLMKEEVRKLARDFDLPAKNRKDSQGICFLGKIKFREFVKAHVGEKPGDIVEKKTQKKLGTHPGFYFFTIGQREGLGLHGGPWYVVEKDVEKNIVFVSNKPPAEHEGIDWFMIDSPNWIASPPSEARLEVKVRHSPNRRECVLNENIVTITGKDEGIAPGQFAVFYENDVCLGGARILKSTTTRK